MDTDAAVSLFLPLYNEAGTVEDVVADCLAALRDTGRPFELLLVDDGSTDGTAAIVDTLAEQHDAVQAVHHDRNRGYGRALATGFDAARHPLVAYMDGDGQFDPADLPRLLEAAQDADLVAGYRNGRDDPFRRRLVGAGFNHLARTLLPISVRDVDCGFKLVRQDVLETVSLVTERTVDAELLAKAAAHGFRIAEVPVTHRSRRAGASEAAGLLGVRVGLIGTTMQELAAIRGDLP